MSGIQRKQFDMKIRVMELTDSKRYEEARLLCIKACQNDGSDAEAWFLLGALNGQLGHVEAAIKCCSRVVRLQPDNSEAYYNLAQAYRLNGQIGKALESYQRTLRLDPHHVMAQENLISTQRYQWKHQAQKKSAQSLGGSPLNDSAELIKMGNVARENNSWGEALAYYHAALYQQPDYRGALCNLGLAYQDLRKPERSVEYLARAVENDDASAELHFMLGNALRDTIRLSEAVCEYEKALQINPDYLDALHNIGITRMREGDAEEAVHVFRQVLEMDNNRPESRSCLLMNLNYYAQDSADVFREHLAWEENHGSQVRIQFPARAWEPERKLKIGYVSPDFRAHSVAFFIEPLLKKHDTTKVDVFCYSDVRRADIVTERLKSLSPNWQDIHVMSDDKLAGQIQRDQIDILVDLTGHTSGNRMAVFALKPAPVQVTYLGYPNTTGLSAMDYRMTDAWVDPVGKADKLHSEKLIRLPEGFLCYEPHNENSAYGEMKEKKKGVTFGSFNNLTKVTSAVIALWSRILKSVPDSRLLLKTKPLRDEGVRERIFQMFSEHGVKRDRLELRGWVPGRSDHLDLYRMVDIGLDTFPYNGTTTTCEALWMGVPVISLAGQVHAGRVGVSLLSQTGLTEFIAADDDHYVALAMGLAGNPECLPRLRRELRARVAASPLCDSESFARHVEAAYRQMWRRCCEGSGS